MISFITEFIVIAKLYFLFLSPPKCIPIIFELEYLDIIGDPDEPPFVEDVCFIILSSTDIIRPFENDNFSLPFGNSNINISRPLYKFISFIFLSTSKYCLILSSFNISINV